MLDLNIRPNVLALVRRKWRQPFREISVALGLVDVVGDREKLGSSDTCKGQSIPQWMEIVSYSLANASR